MLRCIAPCAEVENAEPRVPEAYMTVRAEAVVVRTARQNLLQHSLDFTSRDRLSLFVDDANNTAHGTQATGGASAAVRSKLG